MLHIDSRKNPARNTEKKFRFNPTLFVLILLSLIMQVFAIVVELQTSAFADDGGEYAAMAREETRKDLLKSSLVAFDESKIPDSQACKYVSQLKNSPDSSAVPPMLRNVRAIYIQSSKYANTELKLPILENNRMALIAGCFLARRLAPEASEKSQSIIPIFLPDRNVSLATWPEAEEDGKLLIWLELGMTKGENWFEGLAPDGIVTVRVRHYRHDVHTVDDLLQQCSQPFPYTKNQEQFLRFLSNAIGGCLNFTYQPPANP